MNANSHENTTQSAPKKPVRVRWAPYGPDYTRVINLMDRAKADTNYISLVCAAIAQFIMNSFETLTAHDSTSIVCLALRMFHAGDNDPAYNLVDWADAVANFPMSVSIDALLAVNDETFQDALDRMARHKRETYTDSLPHTEEAGDIIHDILTAAKGGADMGFYTFTFANKTAVKNKNGDFAAGCVAPYGGYSAILTPDNKLIKEPCYEGYGKWDDRDIFQLLAEWNKSDIPRLVDTGAMDGTWYTEDIAPVAKAWALGDETLAKTLAAQSKAFVFPDELQRTIGIWLNTRPDILKFPIKIVSVKNRCPAYDTLPPSIQTQ